MGETFRLDIEVCEAGTRGYRAEKDDGGFFGEFVYKKEVPVSDGSEKTSYTHTHTHSEDNKRGLKLIYTMSLVYNSAGSK